MRVIENHHHKTLCVSAPLRRKESKTFANFALLCCFAVRPLSIVHRLLLLCLIIAPALTACGQATNPTLPPAESHTVRIVSSFPTRGTDAAQSKLITQAIDLAIEQRQSPTDTWKIEHIALDGGSGETGDWSAEQETQNATTAANDSSVIAYIGPYTSGATGVALPITNRAGLLQLGPVATWPGLTLGGWNEGEPDKYYPTGQRNYARLMPPDSAQGAAAAWWANKLQAKTVFALSDGSTYSDGLASVFVSTTVKLRLKLAGHAKLDKASDAAALVKASGADLVFYAPSTLEQAVEWANALEKVQSNVKVIVSDTAFKDQLLEQAGNATAQWRFVFNGVECGSCSFSASNFVSDFRKKYTAEPTQFAENAFSLTNWVIAAVNTGAGRDRAKVIEQVLNTIDAQGRVFDKRGDYYGPQMTGYRITNNRFVQDISLEVP